MSFESTKTCHFFSSLSLRSRTNYGKDLFAKGQIVASLSISGCNQSPLKYSVNKATSLLTIVVICRDDRAFLKVRGLNGSVLEFWGVMEGGGGLMGFCCWKDLFCLGGGGGPSIATIRGNIATERER